MNPAIILIAIVIFLAAIGLIITGVRVFSPSVEVVTPTSTTTPAISPPSTPTPTLTPLPTSTPTPTPRSSRNRDIIILPPRDRIVTATPTPLPPPTLTPTTRPIEGSPFLIRTFVVSNFTLIFPANWGVLTCANSPNFELDPLSDVDQPEVICDFAQKSITVILDNDLNNCTGESIQLGGVTAIRSVTQSTNFREYQWCTVTNPVLRVTHRVSPAPSRAASSIDFSSEIENMIANSQFAN